MFITFCEINYSPLTFSHNFEHKIPQNMQKQTKPNALN